MYSNDYELVDGCSRTEALEWKLEFACVFAKYEFSSSLRNSFFPFARRCTFFEFIRAHSNPFEPIEIQCNFKRFSLILTTSLSKASLELSAQPAPLHSPALHASQWHSVALLASLASIAWSSEVIAPSDFSEWFPFEWLLEVLDVTAPLQFACNSVLQAVNRPPRFERVERRSSRQGDGKFNSSKSFERF